MSLGIMLQPHGDAMVTVMHWPLSVDATASSYYIPWMKSVTLPQAAAALQLAEKWTLVPRSEGLKFHTAVVAELDDRVLANLFQECLVGKLGALAGRVAVAVIGASLWAGVATLGQ
mmetsp:Transcript_69060/g.136908  ORF Transcript_69060/g.136908 Transcript_69060/m.136908 type:complete len:116 (-) Transcript_69060:486-833(-)